MEAPAKANEIRAAAAGAIAFGTALFGWVGWLVALWIAAMLLDYLTGTFAAIYNKCWSSSAARQGLWHKLGSIFAVLVAALCDIALRVLASELHIYDEACVVTPVVTAWYFFTELGSITENAAAMGAPVPKVLRRVIERSRDKADR